MAIQKTKEPSKVDAALQRFAEMLIKRMEEMQKDWHQGWIGGGSMFGLPQNISGRTYEGSNAFLLFLHTAENGYKAPVYMTFGQLHKEGAQVLKGEKAVPVFKWGFSIKDKDGKKVTEEEFHNMTDDEKKECNRRPFLKIYPEFNIDQTNMSEVNKEKYDAVVSQFRKTDVPTITDGMYVNKAIDRMMEKQEWLCKIQYDKEEKGAYYNPAKDIVVLPTKAQFRIHPDDPEECFKDGQEYYGTALHEMAHSTGHPSRLDRLKPAAFGSPEYAKEELVAELTSAMVGNTLGFDRRISDNNVAYLQNWTSALRKEPKFIVSVMADVNKASRIIIENIDKQRIALGEKPLVQGALDGVEEKVKNEQQLSELPEYQQTDEQEEELDEELDPEYQKAEEKENVVAHEDSNVQTNVEGLAEDIAETGVPMEQAEKEAKNIVDDKQHEDFHEQEEKQQQAEKEKQQQESKKDEDKPSKGVAHAAILLGALAAAKANSGVWMNKESKSNAEFIFSHTPVTAYNNIMMNLQSDQKGYRTNVFTLFNNAQKNGVAVKQGEKATPFNWTQWDYQNLTDKNDIISYKEYEKLSDEEKNMYGKHASRLTQYIYNIDQTTYPAVGGDQFVTLLKEKGAQQESLKPSTSSSFLKQFDELKAKHPDVIVIMRKDDSYEIYKSDAKKAAEATHLPVTKQEIEGKKIDTVSFSHAMLDVHLPNIIRAGHRVAVCDQLEDPILVKSVPDGKAVLDRAYSTAKAVAKQEGIKYERVMVIQDAKYDKTDDRIEVSGMIDKSVGSERLAALQKANDIYRAVVAATGTENRLDRSGRNSLLPEDDAKHEKLVQELAAGVLMARQGLPATLSKESQKLIPYWERELKENPKMVGVIERDVNNAVETIDNLIANRKVDYKAIRGQLPPKLITDKAENFSLAADLAKLPSIDTKEVVVIRDRKANKVDVILPAGASVEANNEVPGMRKDRISIALKKEGFDEVKFYNAGGSLGLNKPNSYFEGKDVSLNQLKQYQLVNHKTIEVAQQPKQENKVEIEHFEAIKDDYGRWAFYIKAKNEPQFSVYPSKEHMNKYFSVRKTPEEKTTRAALANKWYEVAKQNPDIKVDIISPHPAKDIDMSRIVNPTITKSEQDPKVKLVFATIDGERHHAPVTETQWHRMWRADNKAEYKKAVAAVVFEPVLRKGVESQQTQSEVVKETEKVEVKEASEPETKQEEQEKQSASRGLHL